MELKTFPLKLTPLEHKTIKRRAIAAGVPMYQYFMDLALYGKIQKRKLK